MQPVHTVFYAPLSGILFWIYGTLQIKLLLLVVSVELIDRDNGSWPLIK